MERAGKTTALPERWTARIPRLWDLPRALARCEKGVSAVEFALIAPMLFFSLLAMTDVGLAVNERMAVDQVLRAGAHRAMQDAGESAVQNVLTAVASDRFTVAGATPAPGELALSAQRFCACPATPTVVTACTATCGGSDVSVFYRLSAEKTYDGLFLPIDFMSYSLGEIAFAPSVLVQIR